jgi:hypothetical protein
MYALMHLMEASIAFLADKGCFRIMVNVSLNALKELSLIKADLVLNAHRPVHLALICMTILA